MSNGYTGTPDSTDYQTSGLYAPDIFAAAGTTDPHQMVIDQWSPLAYKAPFTTNGALLAPTWVPRSEQRRLTAYRVLAAYLANVSRLYLPPGTPIDALVGHREYGDADLLVDRLVSGVLGDTPELVVDSAAAELPEQPELPDRPVDPGPGADVHEQRIFDVLTARYDHDATTIIDAWETAYTARPAAVERQRWLRDWADVEGFDAKMVEAEHSAVGLGDVVYALRWDGEQQRPRVDVYDPGFYFPVLTDDTDGYPDKVHVAWEYLDESNPLARMRKVRRLTWELRPVAEYQTGYQDTPSTEACFFTDATWEFAELAGRKVDDFKPERATYATTDDGVEARDLNLRIDFVPVVHVPNTPANQTHFGKSAIGLVTQIIDDLASSDTDMQAASALAAGPVIGLSGAQTTETMTVAPGTVYKLGEHGSMSSIDLTGPLARLLEVNKHLMDRLSQNARIPAELIGRVKASEATSGVALALAFGPFSQNVGVLRLTRVDKYRLLLKMVQRLAVANKVLDGEVLAAHVEFGAFLPSDMTALVSRVVQLLGVTAISHETAVALLVAGGMSIPDAAHEVGRIRAGDPTSAVDVANALGSEQAAADWLGVDLPNAPVPPPAITLPPTPRPAPGNQSGQGA